MQLKREATVLELSKNTAMNPTKDAKLAWSAFSPTQTQRLYLLALLLAADAEEAETSLIFGHSYCDLSQKLTDDDYLVVQEHTVSCSVSLAQPINSRAAD